MQVVDQDRLVVQPILQPTFERGLKSWKAVKGRQCFGDSNDSCSPLPAHHSRQKFGEALRQPRIWTLRQVSRKRRRGISSIDLGADLLPALLAQDIAMLGDGGTARQAEA